MKLGIDFGTTRIVAATADRGNYPLAGFESGDETFEWFPPLVAIRGAERLYGWDAWNAQADPHWTVVRSLKRLLETAGPETCVEAAGQFLPLADLLHGLLVSLHQQLAARFGAQHKFEIMLGVPANANSNQRFLTVDAFRRAGFTVLGLLNEPSAASIEFGHRHRLSGSLLVYDLGGGTFDASLVELGDRIHTVIATQGISTLGGDDFDHLLAELAIGADRLAALEPGAMFRLLEECRRQKEALHPNSRKLVVDLDVIEEGLGQATVAVADFYERCRPLLEETVAATLGLAEGRKLDALYVTGGGSELPLVARMLREEFGRKVKRSEYTRSATAIGLAIQADETSGYTLRDVFTRHFGVWRESDAGARMIFDPIFPRGVSLPSIETRQYESVHNIGHFRYLEAAGVSEDGSPSGDISLWNDIRFPFDPALEGSLENVPVERCAPARIEEHYSCDAAGGLTVTIRNLTANYERQYVLSSALVQLVRPAAKSPRVRRR